MRGERGPLQSHAFEKPEYDPIADNVFDTLSVVVNPVEWNARIEALRNVALEVLDIAKRKDSRELWDTLEPRHGRRKLPSELFVSVRECRVLREAQ